VILHS